MQITEVLIPQSIKIPLVSQDRNSVIQELVSALPLEDCPLSSDDIYKAIMDREAISSTGIGEGVAIPHAKVDIKEKLVMSFGISENEIEFSSMDGKPVKLFFMLLSRKDVAGLHIRMLAKIARFLRHDKFKKELLTAKTPSDVLAIFQEEEKLHPGT
ncbi:MAG: hypothetical protein A2268_09895 [Candidatus Raymondbacteria bacterium RifOxyA12_full_50_37]|uniref:PTS EIIA type-2 domain-containing protein n=1 Tax=Candidatus Raymondbacteria bacterium RIFOXYD12_FULL_49_13 TaxID=1817890 RepID=A0A1F7F4H6_UNCRA|nr:MAG: hypothetical protein A2268_09895 [Candidatus Raymondbacteria bacterium RifOxyA12_full_50_37]OGJ93851.1 MAG: hypothetical protein A2248_06405 [Candidatus Raymondbacteria bacterium RIFOXYA2_FULL_49_16]OGJ97314.1 MAG: hypothetical protein A2487_16420 [Candidatus Raymondbacteria bacterium RifOxyC12_full_50_8]OGJ98281.1 MAG: hypothetical protein A2453_00765 [Candidatus Raymondbacteria bacterium RIFOXYC2_FULL_50_21]OGJ98443.1 MAG: hypothetical protein A2350_14390 [Candidatus Raymondbacteria b